MNTKLILSLSLLFCFFSFVLEGQPNSAPANSGSISFAPFIVQLDLCNERSHIYTHIDVFSENQDNEIAYLKIRPNWGNRETFFVQESHNGFEIDLYNQTVSNDDISMEVSAYSHNNEELFSSLVVPQTSENSIINVSPHMDELLGDFQHSDLSIGQFFCDKRVSQIELLAFFQEYLDLSVEEMCEMIDQYNLLTRLEYQNQVSYLWTRELCLEFERFIAQATSEEEEDGCICNVIATNRAAYFFDNASNGNVNQDGCTDSPPITYCENLEDFNDDDLLISYGRLGAAKGVALSLEYDGCADSPDPFIYRVKAGGAAIAFRSVCINPLTLSGNLTNCEGCIKTIDLEYSYQSASRIAGTAVNNVFCSAEKLEITGEDWATLIVTQGATATVEEANSQKHHIECNIDSPDLQNTITNTSEIISDISGMIGGAITGTAIADAAVQIVDFLQENIFVGPCNGVKIEHYPLIGGARSYELEPGGYFQAVIVSGATVAGAAKNQARGYIKINSDFHMAAAVRTKVDETGDVPSYCTCEKIGAYVLGSLIDVPAPNNCSSAEPNPVFDLSTVFEYDGRSNQMLQNLAGVFLGLHGPWDPKWSNNGGCCTTVDLNCLAECAYIAEPCHGEIRQRQSNPTTSVSNKVSVHPNPFNNRIDVRLIENTIESIIVFNSNGQQVMQYNAINDNSFVIDGSVLEGGLYLIEIIDNNNNRISKRIVKH